MILHVDISKRCFYSDYNICNVTSLVTRQRKITALYVLKNSNTCFNICLQLFIFFLNILAHITLCHVDNSYPLSRPAMINAMFKRLLSFFFPRTTSSRSKANYLE